MGVTIILAWDVVVFGSITVGIYKNCPKEVSREGRAAAKKEFNNGWFGRNCNWLFYRGAKWKYTQQWGREDHRHVPLPHEMC